MLIALLIVLSQAVDPAPDEAAPEAAAPAATDPAAGSEPKASPGTKAGLPAQLNNDLIDRTRHRVERLKDPIDQAEAAAELVRRSPQALNPEDFKRQATSTHSLTLPDVKDFQALPEIDQVRYSAREFFTQLLAGDARAIVGACGFPFQLEERRLQTADELFQEWLRNLRAKRTDLMTLYDIEVLTPADMEKKYGRPPARLQSLPWRNPRTYVAVANVSGHAAVAVLRQTGPGWAVVGYAD